MIKSLEVIKCIQSLFIKQGLHSVFMLFLCSVITNFHLILTMFLKARHVIKSVFFQNILRARCLHVSKEVTKQNIKLQSLDTGVTIVGLNRALSKNSLSKELVEDFYSVLENLQSDKDTRVVVLRSLIPKVFCAGADLKERLTMTQGEVQVFVSKLRTLTNVIENLRIPVIAAIDGAALGGGLEIALACDLRVCSEDSKIGLVETKLGIFPAAGGTQRLPRIVGPAVAKELIFTGRIISGTEAKNLGIMNHAVTQNENGDAAYQKAVELAKEIVPNGPIAVQMAKMAINKGLEVDINSGCAIEESCYARLIPTKDRVEGLLAFKEKRKPDYKGE